MPALRSTRPSRRRFDWRAMVLETAVLALGIVAVPFIAIILAVL